MYMENKHWKLCESLELNIKCMLYSLFTCTHTHSSMLHIHFFTHVFFAIAIKLYFQHSLHFFRFFMLLRCFFVISYLFSSFRIFWFCLKFFVNFFCDKTISTCHNIPKRMFFCISIVIRINDCVWNRKKMVFNIPEK